MNAELKTQIALIYFCTWQYYREVVVLLVLARLLDLVDDGLKQSVQSQFSMSTECFDEVLSSEKP